MNRKVMIEKMKRKNFISTSITSILQKNSIEKKNLKRIVFHHNEFPINIRRSCRKLKEGTNFHSKRVLRTLKKGTNKSNFGSKSPSKFKWLHNFGRNRGFRFNLTRNQSPI